MDGPTPQPDRPPLTACPWCSTSVTPETATCPSCGAILLGDEEPVLPGVTAIDDKVIRGETRPQQRSRLLSWISGDYVEEPPTETDAQAIAPPDPEVQREIRRLELEAEVASLQAELESRRLDAMIGELDDGADEADVAEAIGAIGADTDRVERELAEVSTDTAPVAGAEAVATAGAAGDDIAAAGETAEPETPPTDAEEATEAVTGDEPPP